MMFFCTLVLQFYLQNGQKENGDDTFRSEKKQRKKNSATVMIYVDVRGSVSSEVQITRGIVRIKISKNIILQKI